MRTERARCSPSTQRTFTTPSRETLAMKGTRNLRSALRMPGSAIRSAYPCCTAVACAALTPKNATLACSRARRSIGFLPMRASWERTAQPLLPTVGSQSTSRAPAAKWSSWISICSPSPRPARSSAATRVLPRQRSMKKTKGSSSRADRFLNGRNLYAIVLRQFAAGIPTSETVPDR